MSAPKPNRNGRLTARQCQVMDLLTTGILNRTIGDELSCSPETVKAHLKQCYRALGVKNRIQAAVLWLKEHRRWRPLE